MPKSKINFRNIKVYFSTPDVLLREFDKAAKAKGFTRHEALRQAMREFLLEWGEEKEKSLSETMDELVTWADSMQKRAKLEALADQNKPNFSTKNIGLE